MPFTAYNPNVFYILNLVIAILIRKKLNLVKNFNVTKMLKEELTKKLYEIDIKQKLVMKYIEQLKHLKLAFMEEVKQKLEEINKVPELDEDFFWKLKETICKKKFDGKTQEYENTEYIDLIFNIINKDNSINEYSKKCEILLNFFELNRNDLIKLKKIQKTQPIAKKTLFPILTKIVTFGVLAFTLLKASPFSYSNFSNQKIVGNDCVLSSESPILPSLFLPLSTEPLYRFQICNNTFFQEKKIDPLILNEMQNNNLEQLKKEARIYCSSDEYLVDNQIFSKRKFKIFEQITDPKGSEKHQTKTFIFASSEKIKNFVYFPEIKEKLFPISDNIFSVETATKTAPGFENLKLFTEKERQMCEEIFRKEEFKIKESEPKKLSKKYKNITYVYDKNNKDYINLFFSHLKSCLKGEIKGFINIIADFYIISRYIRFVYGIVQFLSYERQDKVDVFENFREELFKKNIKLILLEQNNSQISIPDEKGKTVKISINSFLSEQPLLPIKLQETNVHDIIKSLETEIKNISEKHDLNNKDEEIDKKLEKIAQIQKENNIKKIPDILNQLYLKMVNEYVENKIQIIKLQGFVSKNSEQKDLEQMEQILLQKSSNKDIPNIKHEENNDTQTKIKQLNQRQKYIKNKAEKWKNMFSDLEKFADLVEIRKSDKI